MAKGKKTGGRDFLKGSCPNPKGRPTLSSDIKAIRSEMLDKCIISARKFIEMPYSEVKNFARQEQGTSLDFMMCSAILSAIKGSSSHLNIIFDRIGFCSQKPNDATLTQVNITQSLVDTFPKTIQDRLESNFNSYLNNLEK